MFMEHRAWNSCGFRFFHPHDPGKVVFEGCSKDMAFAAMLGECFSAAQFVVNKGFHSYGNKGFCFIVMWAIHICVG